MAHHFTREEAEALLPEITVVLHKIRSLREKMRSFEEDLAALQLQAMGNGYHLHDRISRLQNDAAASVEALRSAVDELEGFDCTLKDPDMGLIDFLSLRDGQEVYLCWLLGEERILFWHYLHTGFASRQPL